MLLGSVAFMSSSERVPGRRRREFEIADIGAQPYPHPRVDRDHDDVVLFGGSQRAFIRKAAHLIYGSKTRCVDDRFGGCRTGLKLTIFART